MPRWLIGFDPHGPDGCGWFAEAEDGEKVWAPGWESRVPTRSVTVAASPRPRAYAEAVGDMAWYGDCFMIIEEGSAWRAN